jgi:hypothetical protein
MEKGIKTLKNLISQDITSSKIKQSQCPLLTPRPKVISHSSM